jgi:hypothetical protein
VMQLLGHKQIQNTLIYTQLANFEDDECILKATSSTEEARQLVEAGFDYICTTPTDVMLFWKRKQVWSVVGEVDGGVRGI